MAGCVMDAAFNVVHDYPGGAAALSERLGKGRPALSHEVKGDGSAKLGLKDAVKVSILTGDTRIAQAFAQAVGGAFVPGAAAGRGLGDADLTAVGETMREVTEAVSAFCVAMADGKVSANELAAFEREALEGTHCLMQLVARARQVHEAGKPGYLRAVGGGAA